MVDCIENNYQELLESPSNITHVDNNDENEEEATIILNQRLLDTSRNNYYIQETVATHNHCSNYCPVFVKRKNGPVGYANN